MQEEVDRAALSRWVKRFLEELDELIPDDEPAYDFDAVERCVFCSTCHPSGTDCPE